MIDLLHLLVKYGYYANLADIENLMPLLISLLDGSNDKPSIQASKEEHKDFTKVLITHDIVLFLMYVLVGWSFQKHRRK